MLNYKLFKLVYEFCVPSLFAEKVYRDGQKALRTAIREDFLKQRELKFVNPNNGKTYIRHYACMPQGDVAILDIGYFVDGDFIYATVGINNSKLRYEPYVAIVEHKPAFKNADVVAKMVESSINWVMKPRGLKVHLEPWDVKRESEKIMWMRDFVEAYFCGKHQRHFNPMANFGYEMLQERLESMGKKEKKNIKSDNFADYIMVKNKVLVISKLHSMIDELEYPIDMMRAVRAMKALGILGRVVYKAFVKEFHKENLIKKSAYNGYMDLLASKYEGDELYKHVKIELEAWIKANDIIIT